MKIRINKKSEIPIYEQIAEQIIFLIATDELKLGDALPSVRQLARQLRVHRNTVSRVYADLVRRGWISGKRGGRLMVRPQDEFTRITRAQDLDSMINAVIRVARQGGHSLQELRKQVRDRLLEQPPDHLLVIEDDPGLLKLLQEEIKRAVRWPVRACCGQDLRSNAGLAVGALPVLAQHFLPEVASLLPKTRPAVCVTYSLADEHLQKIRKLCEPSVIALVSVSEAFLRTARGLLAPALENRHTLLEVLWPAKRAADLRAADLVFCDSITFEKVQHPRSAIFPDRAFFNRLHRLRHDLLF